MYTDTNICVITGRRDCKERNCELHYMDAPLKLAPDSGFDGYDADPFDNGPFYLSARDCRQPVAWHGEAMAPNIERDYLD